VSRLRHPALGFRNEPKRFYPKGRIACHVLGFVGVDNVGLEGVEAGFDRELGGSLGYRWYTKDALQKMLAISDLPDRPAVDGNDIWLTIDLFLQDVVEKELRTACEAWEPLSACCIVMDPRSGEILALANVPDFSPAAPGKASDRRNRAITDPYEPGSTFKTFAVAAALEAGVVTPETKIDCSSGAYTFRQGKVRRTLHDYHPYGKLTVSDVIAKSSNIGTVKVALRMSTERYLESLARLDIENPTGIELPGEAGGWMAPKGWSYFSRTSVPWGQEVAITPLKLLVCFNALVNGGEMMRPSILRRVRSPDGEVLRTFAPEKAGSLISPAVSAAIRKILHRTVEKGTGRRARVEGYTLGGKTGTKTKVSPQGYCMKRSITSFICSAPAHDPKVSLLVMLDEPTKGAAAHYLTGGKVAAPVAAAILSKILPYLGLEKEKEGEE
jgi:cell division protein FtsI (penicillin-binding protein 3)